MLSQEIFIEMFGIYYDFFQVCKEFAFENFLVL